jgi:rhodanese-related sulfurtransferase
MTQILAATGAGIGLLAGIAYYLKKHFRNHGKMKNDYTVNDNLKKLITQEQYEYYLIDVRSENEFRKGHIPTAVNVPYGQLNSYLPSDNLFSNMIVYGRSPLQSSRAASILENSGYFNVTSFGPFFRWRGEVDRSSGRKAEVQKKSS